MLVSGRVDFFGTVNSHCKNIYQVIQFVTFFYPLVGSHQQPLKESLNHHKKVTKNLQVYIQPRWFQKILFSTLLGKMIQFD